MSIDAELQELFAADIESVIADSDRFRRKLGIGGDAFKLLTRAENTSTYVNALTSGAGVAGASYAAWISSLGVFGKVGVGVGLVATPVGWVGAAGVVGAGTFLITSRLLRKMRKATTEEIPRYINTPLDVLGVSISDVLAPILCKIVLADGQVRGEEILLVRAYLCDEWGYDHSFVKPLLEFDARHSADWEWTQLGDAIRAIESTGDVRADDFTQELIRIAEEVAWSDGHLSQEESLQLEKMRDAIAAVGHPASRVPGSDALRGLAVSVRRILKLS